MSTKKLGFSLIELSIVILIIGVLIIGISKGSRIIYEARLKSARTLSAGSPVNITSDLVLWLDATDLTSVGTGSSANGTTYATSIPDGSMVTTWKDRAITNNSQLILSTPNDAGRPTFVKSCTGGLPCLKFYLAGNYLVNPMGIIRNGENYTMIAVFQRDDIVSQYLLFAQFAGSTFGSNLGIFMDSNTFGAGIGALGYGSGYDYNPLATAANTPYITVVRFNKNQAAKYTIQLNSSTQSGNPGNTPNPQFAPIYVGGNSGGSGNSLNFNGRVSELIVFNRALTDSEITNIKNYLSKKYSIKI